MEDEDCDMGVDKGDTYHGSFGEDGNNTLEREEALGATKEKHVGPMPDEIFDAHALTFFCSRLSY